jgi:hypothetical protein
LLHGWVPLPLVALLPSIFASISSSWPKTIYTNGLNCDVRMGGSRDRKPRKRESAVHRRRKIGEATASGIASDRLIFFLTNISSLLSTVRRK